MRDRTKAIGLVLGPLLFLIVQLWIRPEGLSADGRSVLAGTLWIAAWWVTEAIPIAATSLLPIIIFPIAASMPIATVSKMYGHPLVFLYVGGFIIAMTIEKWDLHKRIALNVIRFIGTNQRMLVLGFMLATALLSMWISNSATSVMMLPIGMAIVTQFGVKSRHTFGKALMLSIAYSASIGGVATLIGTPTNLVLAGIVEEMFEQEITFSQWMAFGLPISLILLAICWLYLTRVAYKVSNTKSDKGAEAIRNELRELGKMSRAERSVAIVFGLTALAWISRSFVLEGLLPGINDTIIALAGALVMFMIPSGKEGEMLLDWQTAVKIPWGIALLFGGGLAIAEGFQVTGLAEWIGNQMTLMQGLHFFVFILLLVALVNFLTEITSNVATASMLLPILAALSAAIDVHPYGLMVAATLAASCAFMLPVATPPNAVVFGSGYLRIADMASAGFWMNLISILLLSLMVYFYLPFVWGIDLR